MTKQDIETALLASLERAQRRLGQVPARITEETAPMGDLQGFDSLIALEVAIELEGDVGCKLGIDLFFDLRTKKPRTRRDIVAALVAKTGAAK